MRLVPILLALWAFCSVPLHAREVTPARSVLAADTVTSTASGATFTAPLGWTAQAASPAVWVLSAPEPDSRLAVVEVGAASSARDAAIKAWKLYRPEATPTFKLATLQAPQNGWEERQFVEYETPPNVLRAALAIALRVGSQWTVQILDSQEAVADKRWAAIDLVFQSVRPKGFMRETFAGRPAHRLDAARIAQIKTFVEISLRELGIPGAGLALIDQGQVVYEGGLGVRELGRQEPVDAHTRFMIASNTKSMSTLLLAQLVDEGRLGWDQPVVEIFPAFRLGSPEITKKVLVRHLVCACTGLPRKDLEWSFNTRPDTQASATFDQLAGTEPTSAFGEVFQYNNLMAAAAGYIGGHIAHPEMELGAAYDSALQQRIFDPLGMADTTFSLPKALAGNRASPHGTDLNGATAVASMDFNAAVLPYRPAGGAWSSAHDMAAYVRNELSLGVLPDGKRLVSAANLLERRKPGVSTGENMAYGMGLESDKTWGVEVIHHGGSLVGYKSDFIIIPDAGVGAVLLTNADQGGALLGPFMRRLLEVLYDGRSEASQEVSTRAGALQARNASSREGLSVPPPEALVAALAARYENPDLGHIDVSKDASGLLFDFGGWRSHAASRRNADGTISFVTIDPGIGGDQFLVSERSGRPALILRDSQHEYVYLARP